MNTHDIKRYAVSGDIAYPIHEDPEGDYVTYEDHVAAIEADRQARNCGQCVPLSTDGKSVFIDGVGEVPLDFGGQARGEPVAWQPIETAPKDGTTILVWFKQHGAMTVCWGDRDYDHTSEYAIWLVDDHKHGPYPVRGYSRGDDTHWMPIPPAPQPPQIPEGYALVPIEPTPEMLKSGWAENDVPLSVRWKAMLEAAPEVKP